MAQLDIRDSLMLLSISLLSEDCCLLTACSTKYITMTLQENIVTVLLPVYNAQEFLWQCLESLREQSYGQLQIIAIDDHSKDSSFKILHQFKKQYKNSFAVEIFRNKKRYGLAVCYNRALKLARGRFVAFMSPHDVNGINRFKRQVNFLLQHPKTVAVGTQYTGIDKDNRKLERSDLPQAHEEIYHTLLPSSPLHPETVMIDRTMLPKDLLHFKSPKYPFVFTEVFVKLFQYGQVANIAHSLYFHREGVKRPGRKGSRTNQVYSLIKLLLTSRANYDYRPSLRSLFSPMMKGV